MAEGEGFEPPLPFRVKRFSRPPVSTAHTSLRGECFSSLAVLENLKNSSLLGLLQALSLGHVSLRQERLLDVELLQLLHRVALVLRCPMVVLMLVCPTSSFRVDRSTPAIAERAERARSFAHCCCNEDKTSQVPRAPRLVTNRGAAAFSAGDHEEMGATGSPQL
jgi:hypothetical protein